VARLRRGRRRRINGCGIAREAAGRGFSVFVCERDDLAIRHVVRLDQADPRWTALPRAVLTPADAVWTYSGVRPLYHDGTLDARSVTRDFVLELDAPRGSPALLSVFGGKIATFRVLARTAVDKIARHLPAPPAPSPGWSRDAPLPGGDFPVDGFAALVDGLAAAYPAPAHPHLHRLARSYGTRAAMILAGARTMADLGHSFGADLTEREVRYVMAHEWARTADDIVWRRSKLGLRLAPEEIARLDAWMKAARLEGAPA
jgi:glycerol-3-phosphate dehydrogenase